jgi:replicative DNA helicase
LSSFSDIEIKELYDNKAVLMLFGALMNNPTTLLKHDRYRLEVSDFVARHHKIIFSAINNLVNSGVDKLDSISIDSYLNKYPEQYKIFSDNRGLEALEFARNTAKGDNFVYYYNRVKKFSLLRAYLKSGIDIRFIYDPDEINTGKKEKMQTNLDSLTINEIIELVDMKIVDIRQSFELSADSYGQRAGQDIKELIDDLLEAPAIGLPLNGKFINSIVRGARLKKLYMRSAPTGVGKTRFSAGDSINLAVATI